MMLLQLLATFVGLLVVASVATLAVAIRADLAARKRDTAAMRPAARPFAVRRSRETEEFREWLYERIRGALAALSEREVSSEAAGILLLSDLLISESSSAVEKGDPAGVDRAVEKLHEESLPVEELGGLPVGAYLQLKRAGIHDTWSALLLPATVWGDQAESIRLALQAWLIREVPPEKAASVKRLETTVQIYVDAAGNARFRVVQDDHVLVTSEAFTTTEAALDAASALIASIGIPGVLPARNPTRLP